MVASRNPDDVRPSVQEREAETGCGRGRKARYPYVKIYRDRHGKERIYYRRPGYPTVALPGPYGSPEFVSAWQTAFTGQKVPKKANAETKSLSDLIDIYRLSSDYLALQEGSQISYSIDLEVIRRKYGEALIPELTRRNVRDIISDAALKSSSHAQRVYMYLSILIPLALDLEWLDSDPMSSIRRPKHKVKSHHTWTEEEINQFQRFWIRGTRERTAFDLLLYTTQRSSDVRQLRWSQFTEEGLELTQDKTETSLFIPILPELAETLEQVTREGDLLFPNGKGSHLGKQGFLMMLSKAFGQAGLPKRCVPHGLRHAGAKRMAEAECTEEQMMAITGHTSAASLGIYLKAVSQKKSAKGAAAKLAQASLHPEHRGSSPNA